METGKVLSIKDNVIIISGLDSAAVGELLHILFPDETYVPCMILSLNLDNISAVLLKNSDSYITEGLIVEPTGSLFNIHTGDHLLNHVVDPFGYILDNTNNDSTENDNIQHNDIHNSNNITIEDNNDIHNNSNNITIEDNNDNISTIKINVERKAPGVITRQSVTIPLLTGYKVIDSLLPIGRGQRELIIGDRQLGKRTLAIDSIINQNYTNTFDMHNEEYPIIAVYVAIGQKASTILSIANLLEKTNSMRYTIIINTSSADAAALQFLAPYSGCTIAEYFRDNGRDALIIYDDLSRHAISYRQLSLLLRRPPGREAYPGDIFYVHSRLLERACKLNQTYGGGSITALPIIETLAGDLSAYIPTNVISITDGQIFLEKHLFFSGIRPAVNVGNSVSRVGSKAQPYGLRLVSSNLRFQLAQYREFLIFSQFDSDIDPITAGILKRGGLLTEIMKQPANKPLSLFLMISSILAAAYEFIQIEDFKKDLKSIVQVYENNLHQTIQIINETFYKPLSQFYNLGSKELFIFDTQPALISLLISHQTIRKFSSKPIDDNPRIQGKTFDEHLHRTYTQLGFAKDTMFYAVPVEIQREIQAKFNYLAMLGNYARPWLMRSYNTFYNHLTINQYQYELMHSVSKIISENLGLIPKNIPEKAKNLSSTNQNNKKPNRPNTTVKKTNVSHLVNTLQKRVQQLEALNKANQTTTSLVVSNHEFLEPTNTFFFVFKLCLLDRINLMNHFIQAFGKWAIKAILGDREFIATEGYYISYPSQERHHNSSHKRRSNCPKSLMNDLKALEKVDFPGKEKLGVVAYYERCKEVLNLRISLSI